LSFIQVIDFQVWFMLALSANFGFFGVDFDEKITKKIFYSKVRFSRLFLQAVCSYEFSQISLT